MKYQLLLSVTLVSASFFSTAKNSSKNYAIKGKANNSFFWPDIKQVDLTTGKVNKTVFEAEKTAFKITALEKTPVSYKANENKQTELSVTE